MNTSITFEVCIDSVEGAMASEAGGAHCVELCDNLMEGGTTPSAGAIQLARRQVDIGLNVMIRPRGGDFCYSDIEYEVMKCDIEMAKRLGADGVVFGLLNEDGTVDVERTRELVALARPMSVTCHRAFDVTRDPYEALETLITLGVDRVLTSGQENSVLEGLDLIAELVQKAGNRIIVMPGGDISERTIKRIVEQSGAREVHFASFASVDSHMTYRNTRVYMGGMLRQPEFVRQVTDSDRVKAFVSAME